MAISRFSRFSGRAAFVLTCAFPAQAVLAQTIPAPSQTPPGVEAERQSKDAEISFTIGGALSPPDGAGDIELTIGSIVVEGGFDPVSLDTNAMLPKPGAVVRLADIYASAAAIQQAYLSAGYPLVRVFVPVQDLDNLNAQVRLTVVSGYIGQVRADSIDPRVRAVIERYLTPLVGKQNLRASVLERAVLLAGDVSGVNLASALAPGQQTGETMLIVSGGFQPVQAVLSADNRLSPELGREQLTLSAAFNSPLGLGERIGVTFATALDDPSLGRSALRRYAGVYADMPIGNDGLVIGADASASTARPRGAATPLALASRFEHFGGRVSYPIVRNRTHRLILSGSFDLNEETQDSLLLGFPVALSRDQTRVGRVSLNASTQSRNGLFADAQIEYARGMDVLDARRSSEATIFNPLSRIGADAVFDKLSTSILIEAALPRTPLTGHINIRAQTGFGDPLLRSEQMSVAAPDLISGPPSGSLVGDSAIAARYQIEAGLNEINARVTPYGFAAVALAWLEQPTFFELGRTETHAFGAGINAKLPVGSLILTGQVEFSHTQSNDFNARGNWVTFQVAVRF